MDFETLQRRLLASVRSRVQNGELTERGLARMTGISQPHIHHILKGARGLSVENADRILRRLDMTVLDLLEGGELMRPASPRRGRHAAGVRSKREGPPPSTHTSVWMVPKKYEDALFES
jgi:transcriptional regulator with XRE-family HTH domain